MRLSNMVALVIDQWSIHCHHMAAINITEQAAAAAAAAAAASFEVYNCHENHLLRLNLGAGVNRDLAQG